MKFSVLVVTAITAAVLAADEHLDIRSCVCSSAKGSCDCDDAVKYVQVHSDAVPSCIASRGWQNIAEQPYADNSCGHARLFADVVCIRDDETEAYPHDPCGAAHRFAVRECSLEKRSQDEFYATDACTTGQKRAADCLRRRGQFPGLPGTWCGNELMEVEKHCKISMGLKGENGFPDHPCGRRRCAKKRSPENPFPGDICGRRRCAKKRSPEIPRPPDVCGRRRCSKASLPELLCGPALRLARSCVDSFPHDVCGGVSRRATECVMAQGWQGLPWDVCGSDEDCAAAAKRDLGYEIKAKRDPVESAAACEYSSRGGRRAVAPPHCMCPVERDETGIDAVKRCRCGGEETEDVNGTQYHCMCLTGEGDATAPCSCNSDVAFLSKVQYQ